MMLGGNKNRTFHSINFFMPPHQKKERGFTVFNENLAFIFQTDFATAHLSLISHADHHHIFLSIRILLCAGLLLCSLGKSRKGKRKNHKDLDQCPPPPSPPPPQLSCNSSLYPHTHEKTNTSVPLLMAGTLFISPANLSSFPFRNRGTRG